MSPRSTFERLAVRATVLPILVVLLFAGVVCWQVVRLVGANRWVDYTDQAIAQAYRLEGTVIELQDGLSGYLLTGAARPLARYHAAGLALPGELFRLDAFVSGNPAQIARLSSLRASIRDWQALADGLLRARPGSAPDVGRVERGQDAMSRIRAGLAEFIGVEEDLRDARSASAARIADLAVGVTFLVLLATGFALALFLRRQLAERNRAEYRIRQLVNGIRDYAIVMLDLQGRVMSWNPGVARIEGYSEKEILGRHFSIFYPPEDVQAGKTDRELREAARLGRFEDEGWRVRKDGSRFWASVVVAPLYDDAGKVSGFAKITRDLSERKRSDDRLAQARRELEERGAALAAANSELEAFSYSVSHDLRAPLRGIDGFSQALIEDFGDKLGPEGKDYLARVRAGVQRMGTLIDDLLLLSRLSRAELRRESVDVSALAESIFEDLSRTDPRRKVGWSVAPGMRATADPGLLRAALENLLSNAWKFTSKTEAARIEVGQSVQDGRPVYFVRDNGAGFNMEYAGKLFGAFQRLHRSDEFAGTGIGLATVRRVIQRHGGRIWAEAAEGKGATFYFTLGSAASEAGQAA